MVKTASLKHALATVLILILSLAIVACGEDGSSSPPAAGEEQPEQAAETEGSGESAESLLDWMAANPESVGLAVLLPEGEPLLVNAEEPFPLASVRKVLVVGAAVDAGELDGSVPRADVERFYAPGTDGGAHEQAGLDAPQLPLEQVAAAAIAVSDNAAADLILDRVGTERVDAWASDQGMSDQDPIYPLLGEYAAWTEVLDWMQLSPEERAEEAIQLAESADAKQLELPSVAEQAELAAASVAGTPTEWAELMQRIGTEGDPQLQALLDWPRAQSPELRRELDAYLTKGGTLAGIVTDASYIAPKGEDGTAVALFLRDLPLDVQAELGESFAQQELVRMLATDPEQLEVARELLSPEGRARRSRQSPSTSTRSSMIARSAAFAVTSGTSWTFAVAAIARSIARRRGCPPRSTTAAAKRPHSRPTRSSIASG